MSSFFVSQDDHSDFTIVANRFIDEYMEDANDAQLKIYLFLLRALSSGMQTGISDIADRFNYTEKDVLRALLYWEKKGILSIEYSDSKTISGIRMLSFKAGSSAPSGALTPLVSKAAPDSALTAAASQTAPTQNPLPSSDSARRDSEFASFVTVIRGDDRAKDAEEDPYAKPAYTADQLRAFRDRDTTAQLIFIAEQYLQKTLSPSEMRSILFLSDKLKFSEDLIDYLLQYCVDHGKKDLRYMEKVAINWAQSGITTPKQAARFVQKYDKTVYQIMNALGKSNAPTDAEVDFIRKWTESYGFDQSLILMACERTVLATDKHRFEYADGILSNWHRSGVQRKEDVQQRDEQHKKQTAAKSTTGRTSAFHQFTQTSGGDISLLEQQLLGNQ